MSAARARPEPPEDPDIIPMPDSFSALPESILRMPGLSAPSKVLLMSLIRLCPGRRRYTRATNRRIAVEAGMHPTSVKRHLKKLVTAGLIHRRPDPQDVGRAWITSLRDPVWRGLPWNGGAP